MAAFASSGWFLKGLTKLLKGQIDFENDTIIIIPVSATPDQATDEYVDDLTEINGPNGRATLANPSFNEDTGNLEAEVDFDDATMSNINGVSDFVGYVVAKNSGADSTSPLLAYANTTDVTPNGGSIKVTFAAEGVLKLKATSA